MNDLHGRSARARAAMFSMMAMGAVLLGGTVVACGSDARPAASEGDGVDDTTPPNANGGGAPDGEAAAESRDGAAKTPEAAVPSNDGGTFTPPDLDGGPYLLCQQDTAVFNLTEMGPAPGSSAAFTAAWDHEVGVPVDPAKLPSLVLAGKNLRTGPLDVRIGPVLFTSGAATIPTAGAGSAMLALPNHASTRIALSRTPLAFKIAFGPTADRHVLDVVAVAMEFDVQDNCDSLSGNLSLDIAGTSGSVAFGDGTTLAQVLGPLTTDTDFDTVKDAWTIELTSNRGDIPAVGYTP